MVSLFSLFATFAKIGGFTIGGGYAMLPLVEREVIENKKWVSRTEFLDMLSLAQSLPGIWAVNISIFVGHRARGTIGAIVATLGTVLPSFITILIIAMSFTHFADNPWVERFFMGVRPAVIALIVTPMIKAMRQIGFTLYNVSVTAVTALFIWKMGVSPILIILVMGIGGVLLFWARQKRVKS